MLGKKPVHTVEKYPMLMSTMMLLPIHLSMFPLLKQWEAAQVVDQKQLPPVAKLAAQMELQWANLVVLEKQDQQRLLRK